ncbi:hypothetical protein PRZ48_007000 [Zasmidium cellare]|uniref:Exocyst complex component Sec8 n=1 Tax=Zasmidium cellare TaxID=395010 RepID=A0ABR0EJ92_ZASCE|nr:hypothetical protein PRZ48_007000 [Zasmidium cellare]
MSYPKQPTRACPSDTVALTNWLDIIRFIEQQWSFMADENCIAVKVALQFMDNSSLGLADQQDQFQEAHKQLQNALKVIVNQHHQGFNSSIGTFHKIQAAIHASQVRVRTLREGLVQAKGSLATGKPELKAFAQSSQSYDQMLQMLGTIEQLQQVPEQLEAQISEKRFLGAVDTLQEALGLIRKPEMEDIGALSDLRVYLGNQEHSLTDILIEELHNHLYLKSPYCEERWKSHMRRDPSNPTMDDGERAMHSFLDMFDGSRPMLEDATRNPEADTFYYIQLLVESLNKMARLDVAVDAIEHRLPVELFTVVERSHREVEQRHPSIMRNAARAQRKTAGFNAGPDGERAETLEDLLTTLFAKYEAIAEGHRVLHDVSAAIIKRDGYEDANLNRSFRELWKLLQSEIRSLLHDHLASNGNLGHRSQQEKDASANIFRPQPRDRNRKIFKMADVDLKATELATEREDLEFILRQSVPGLVGNNARDTKQDRDVVTDVSATGHKLLVEPSVFNMGILLKPSLDFLTRLKEVVPPNSGVVSSTLTSFLDDFLINVFYPQLDETLLDFCGRAMNEMDAFQSHEKWQSHSARPIFKGTARFFELIEAFCVMLDSLPHDQSFSQLIITQMRTYYDRCYQWSKSLLQRVQLDQEAAVKMRLAAQLATSGDINQVVIDLTKASKEEAIVLAEKETALLLKTIKTRTLEEADLINDRKALAALCTLQVSMKWLASRCQQLRYISPRAVDTQSMQSHDRRRWTQNFNVNNAPSGPYLPLDQQTAAGFDAVIASFNELSSLILRTLHIDLRLQLLHGIYSAMDTTYALGQPYNDPDPSISNLSASLGSYEAVISQNLLETHYDFLTSHLDTLANNAMVSLVGCIQALDKYGSDRMGLNILVLQQKLKQAMQQDASLEYAARFYGMTDVRTIVSEVAKREFATEDRKALVRLTFDAERDGAEGNVEGWVAQCG